MKKFILMLPFFALIVMGAECPGERNTYEVTFIHADPDSGGVDAVAKSAPASPTEQIIATGREIIDGTGDQHTERVSIDNGTIVVREHGTTNELGTYPLTVQDANHFNFIFLGAQSVPQFLRTPDNRVSGPTDYVTVVNAGRTVGNVDVYVTTDTGPRITPTFSLAHGSFDTTGFPEIESRRVRITPAGNNGVILANVLVGTTITVVFKADPANPGSFFVTTHS